MITTNNAAALDLNAARECRAPIAFPLRREMTQRHFFLEVVAWCEVRDCMAVVALVPWRTASKLTAESYAEEVGAATQRLHGAENWVVTRLRLVTLPGTYVG